MWVTAEPGPSGPTGARWVLGSGQQDQAQVPLANVQLCTSPDDVTLGTGARADPCLMGSRCITEYEDAAGARSTPRPPPAPVLGPPPTPSVLPERGWPVSLLLGVEAVATREDLMDGTGASGLWPQSAGQEVGLAQVHGRPRERLPSAPGAADPSRPRAGS